MTSEKDARRIAHGETYEHSVFGNVEVVDITDPIVAIGPNGPERNYHVRFTTPFGVDVVRDSEVHTRTYEEFIEGLE